ncbi:unnamed protein product [Phytomonas sp. EM1]|nr:unnamed protein product [Phytomonas sp. EM1]|eukprot:CCW59821.1 unnamed protein product [Phytomonas sp. isolate EM1]
MFSKVKDEFSQENKYSSQIDVGDDFNGDEEQPLGTVYICANCTTHVTLTPSSALCCATCEHLTGSSTVFYKVRTQATTYDTI